MLTRGRVDSPLLAVAAVAAAVVCCAGLPAIVALTGGIAITAVVGVAGGALALAAVIGGAVLLVHNRRRRGSLPTASRRPARMKIELLYFDGCPNHETLLPRLRELLERANVSSAVELVQVPDDAAARRERFLGSPTLRVDGRDVEPGAEERTDYGLKCRLYRTPEGIAGIPPDTWVLEALGGPDRG